MWRLRIRKLRRFPALIAAPAALIAGQLQAQTTASWIGSPGTWSDPTKWSTNPFFPNNGNPSGSSYDARINDGNLSFDQPITIDSLTFEKRGYLILNGHSLTATNGITLNGQIYIQDGQLISQNGPINIGAWPSGSGTRFVNVPIISDVHVLNGGRLSVGDVMTLNGSTVTVAGQLSVGSTDPLMIGIGTITGTGIVKLNGGSMAMYRLQSEVLSPPGTLAISNGVTLISDGGRLDYSTIINYSTAHFRSGITYYSKLINNGTFDVTGGSLYGGWGPWSVTNNGTFVVHDGGFLSLGNRVTNLSNDVLTGGYYAVHDGSKFNINSITTNAADVLLSGPTSSMVAMNSLQNNQGKFTITNGRNFTTAGSLDNSGLLAIGPGSTMRVTGDLNNTGSINLNGTLIVDGSGGESSLVDSLVEQILSGRNGGAWDGATGIGSSLAAVNDSLAIGYASNATLGVTSVGGVSVNPDSVLLKLTYAGDSNLDGIVNVLDIYRLAMNWQNSSDWFGGDFNYDGMVDAADLGLLGQNWLAGSEISLNEELTAMGLPAVSIPEPGTLLASMLGASTLTRSRRRRLTTSHPPAR